MSPFSRKELWLTYPEAARLLGVNFRTLKRWMRLPKMRTLLGAVRRGKQWRIARPANPALWAAKIRQVQERPVDWRARLRRKVAEVAKDKRAAREQALRLWLACQAAAAARGTLTVEANASIALLFEVALEVGVSAPVRNCAQLKTQCTEELRRRGMKPSMLATVMSYWPGDRELKMVQAAGPKQLEAIRRNTDYTNAQQQVKNLGFKPTNENLHQLLHLDLRTHVNDTGEKLSPGTVDLRESQTGATVRTAKKRYSRKRGEAKRIGGIVSDALVKIPGTENSTPEDSAGTSEEEDE